jgi:hypothetical protein
MQHKSLQKNQHFGIAERTEAAVEEGWRETLSSRPDGEFVPYVRPGYYTEDGGLKQKMELVELTDGLPSDADACSQAIYLIRKSHELGVDCPKHPPKLQEWCADSSNDAGEVLYNVVAESDGALEYGLEHVIEWIVRFAESEEWLDVNRDSYQLFYSGNRSVHLHTDRFVVGQKQWEELKKLAEQFCEETGASLDCGIYQSKPQFRSEGAEHHKTGLAKVPIDDDFSGEDAVPKAASFDGSARLPDTFRPDHPAIKHVDTILNENWDVLPDEVQECVLRPDNRVSDNGDDTVENADNAGSQSDDSMAECVDFGLYRCAEGGDQGSNESPSRSVCLAKMSTDKPAEIDGNCYMAADYITAVGANGTYRKDTSPGIIGLSSRDLQKWDADVGDVLVLIGGHNRSARILNLTGEDKLIAKVETDYETRVVRARLERWKKRGMTSEARAKMVPVEIIKRARARVMRDS